MKIKRIILTVFFASALLACKKESPSAPAENGSLTLQFENLVNTDPLILNRQNYFNANGDSFNITTFKYYVSNITLKNADGTSYVVPESYILVDAAMPSTFLTTLNHIPSGDYTRISFTIGVDKDRNLAGAQTGALDPALGMFWTWNSGYIFVKMEGTSPQSSAANHSLTFHIGGIADPNNTIRTFTANLNTANPIRIRSDKNPQVHFKVNVASLFAGKQTINFATFNYTMGGATAVTIADNYANGLFVLDHIHN